MMTNPPDPSRQAPRCEDPVVVPVVDLIGAVAVVAVSSAAALSVRAEDGPPLTSAAILGVGVGLGATLAASSSVGFGRAGRCRRAKDAWAARTR